MIATIRLLSYLLSLILVSTQIISDDIPQGCYKTQYTSQFTRCELTFLKCFTFTQLKTCYKKKCQRFIRANQCRLQTKFQLDEARCYQLCCGSNIFDENKCNQYNDNQTVKQEKTDVVLAVVLAIVAAVLVIIAIIFVIRKVGCCQKRDPFVLLRYNIKWRKDLYQDPKCQICHTHGPMMMTPCKHYFHVSCFQQAAKQMVCPVCKQPILTRIKIYCFMCRQKSFKAKLCKVAEIAQAMVQAKALHNDQCPRQIKSAKHLLNGEH